MKPLVVYEGNNELVVASLQRNMKIREEVFSPCERCDTSINDGIYLEGSYLCHSCLEVELKLIKKPYGLTGAYFYHNSYELY